MEDEGNEHECEFTLYVPKIGEINLKSLFLKKKCRQHRRILHMEK